MKILIVDDEPLARKRLTHLLEQQQDCEVVGEAVNGQEALEKTQQLKPDLLLMDIRMPGMDGIEAARHLDLMDDAPKVIFTTAYNEYALEAFDVHAIGYLVKPVRAEKLHKAIKNAHRPAISDFVASTQSELPKQRNFISAPVRGNIELVAIKDIYYFHADQKYTQVVHRTGNLLLEESLKSLQQEFSQQFVRIHRNALVSTRYIKGFSKDKLGRWYISFSDINTQLEVSKRHVPQIRKLIKNL